MHLFNVYVTKTFDGVEAEFPIMVIAPDFGGAEAEARRRRPDLFRKGWVLDRIGLEMTAQEAKASR